MSIKLQRRRATNCQICGNLDWKYKLIRINLIRYGGDHKLSGMIIREGALSRLYFNGCAYYDRFVCQRFPAGKAIAVELSVHLRKVKDVRIGRNQEHGNCRVAGGTTQRLHLFYDSPVHPALALRLCVENNEHWHYRSRHRRNIVTISLYLSCPLIDST